MHQYGLQGGGGWVAGAGVGASGVKVFRVQMLMQRAVHAAEIRTWHVV